MLLPIYTYGMAVLRKPAQDITPDYPDLPVLIDNMFETMRRSDGVGLAAPQVGLPIRLVVITLEPLASENPAYSGLSRAYINPHILEYDERQWETMDEGCLSLPGISEPVRRPARICVRYFDPLWQQHEEWVDGFLARVMQHEFDHLEGTLFTDRLTPLRKQMVRPKLAAMRRGKVKCNYKVHTPR